MQWKTMLQNVWLVNQLNAQLVITCFECEANKSSSYSTRNLKVEHCTAHVSDLCISPLKNTNVEWVSRCLFIGCLTRQKF